MNGSRNQLFSCPGLTVNQHRRISRCDGFRALQDSAQRSATPDDLSEIHFRSEFIFQIEFFLRKLLFQFPNLAVRKRILDGESNLVCDLRKETDIALTEGVVSEPRDNQRANRAISADQRQKAEGLQTFTNGDLNDRVIDPTSERALERQNFHSSKCRAGGRSFDRIEQVFLQEPFSVRKVNRVESQLFVFRIRERQACVVALHHAPDILRNGTQQIAELQI